MIEDNKNNNNIKSLAKKTNFRPYEGKGLTQIKYELHIKNWHVLLRTKIPCIHPRCMAATFLIGVGCDNHMGGLPGKLAFNGTSLILHIFHIILEVQILGV